MIATPPVRKAVRRTAKAPHRLHALERLLTTAEFLRSRRFGCSLQAVNDELAEHIGQRYHPRTTYRDMELLERMGFVERTGGGWLHPGASFWRWIGTAPLIETRPETIRLAASGKGGAA